MQRRIAARAVIIDEQFNTAILSVNNGSYYKIPGGGLEKGEDINTGLIREIREEAGCKVEIIDKLGEFEFKIHDKEIMNFSVCFLAKLIGEKGLSEFDEGEKQNNFQLLWLPLDEAITRFENCNVDTSHPNEKNMHNRDLNFLKKAKEKFADIEQVHNLDAK